jgi:putative hydrolase
MKILADLHIHTLASGHAYSTMTEVAEAACQKGLELVAVTDHGPAMPGGPHEYYFGNLRVLPDKLHGVKILAGVEANILDEHGTLDMKEVYLERLDLVLAGLHTPCLKSLCRECNTQALTSALQNPYVDIVVHPGNPDFPIHLEKVVRVAAKLGKVLEINNSSFLVRKGSAKACLEIARLCRQYGARISISSDAHIATDVGEFGHALETARLAGIPEENIINLNAARVEQYLAERGKIRFQNQG